MLDETRDISKTEQLAMCVRYVYNAGDHLEVRDEFVSFTPLDRLDSEHVANVIMDNVSQLGLKWENLVAQSYDGASAMSGQHTGVQTRIREKAPTAVYVIVGHTNSTSL